MVSSTVLKLLEYTETLAMVFVRFLIETKHLNVFSAPIKTNCMQWTWQGCYSKQYKYIIKPTMKGIPLQGSSHSLTRFCRIFHSIPGLVHPQDLKNTLPSFGYFRLSCLAFLFLQCFVFLQNWRWSQVCWHLICYVDGALSITKGSSLWRMRSLLLYRVRCHCKICFLN